MPPPLLRLVPPPRVATRTWRTRVDRVLVAVRTKWRLDRVMRYTASSGSALEPEIGFSRAVRLGPHVVVAGTAPIGADGQTVGRGAVDAQTRRCLEVSLEALSAVGASLADVVRTRIMLTDITRWREAAGVHGEYFADIRPVATFVEVSGFIDPDWLVETEIDAIIGGKVFDGLATTP